MLIVYNCIVTQHDLRLVGLAAFICAVASFTAVTLLQHVRKSTGSMRNLWLVVSAVATGFGIWATHFIAMLAFSPGIPSGYNIALTALSLVAAIVLTGAGLRVALIDRLPGAPALGGAIVGGGIAAMHYIGMAAFEIEGWILWNPTLVAASIILGGVLGAAAIPVSMRQGLVRRISAALLLTAAIVSHHFTAMGAAAIVPDPTIAVSKSALPAGLLAIAVAAASLVIIVLAFAGLALDIRDRRRSEAEADHMRGLANAAVEGLIVSDGESIACGNQSFAKLAGAKVDALVGAGLDKYFPDITKLRALLTHANHSVEAELRRDDGSLTPVELIMRPVEFNGKPHCAIAVRDLLARKQAESHIRFLAHHDTLTGLLNRSSFQEVLDQEIEKALIAGQGLAVLCLDLDRFKEVNDLFGHAAGDAVLKTVAQLATGVLDKGQAMGRLGGDEFAIVLPAVAKPGIAGRVAENILDALRSGNAGVDRTALVSVSIGIAMYPGDAVDRQALLTHADTALYRAKMDGRGVYRFFEAKMGAEVLERRLIEYDLRHAVERGELRVEYQPLKSITRDEVIGFEALLRWRHPTRGSISPSLFIPIAEESGAILQIGEWVLEEVCREASSWSENLIASVNVSPIQLYNARFVQTVHEILYRTGMKANRLEFEITETALIRDINRALATLRQLKAMGLRIAMDDFGTGYSSLSNLRSFPFDKIKIDGSFIKSVDQNAQAATIVRAVLGLGRGLGLPVLAEGVETAGELEFLQTEHCDEAQGYLLGRPAPIGRFSRITHSSAPASAESPLAPEQRASFAGGK
ncbi:MAG TPA: EAL domain-containing protein [Roseiarcus sp.]|nr:EAL domain-containing protein [Roseiarcus sp.]